MAEAGYSNTVCNNSETLSLKGLRKWDKMWGLEEGEDADYRPRDSFRVFVNHYRKKIGHNVQTYSDRNLIEETAGGASGIVDANNWIQKQGNVRLGCCVDDIDFTEKLKLDLDKDGDTDTDINTGTDINTSKASKMKGEREALIHLSVRCQMANRADSNTNLKSSSLKNTQNTQNSRNSRNTSGYEWGDNSDTNWAPVQKLKARTVIVTSPLPVLGK